MSAPAPIMALPALPPEAVTRGKQRILNNLAELERATVEDIMTPRSQIEAIDFTLPLSELKQKLSTSLHTRLPVYKGQADNIMGILHLRKVLHISAEALTHEGLKQIIRPPFFVLLGTPLLQQLELFQQQGRRLGLVVDEYGELQGLVTIEDIIEQLIGSFTSHSPLQGKSNWIIPEEGSWIVEGMCSLKTLNRQLGLTLPTEGPRTVNGLLIDYFRAIPEEGTCCKLGGCCFEVLHTQDRMIKTVRVVSL